jgi:hypothetical protein
MQKTLPSLLLLGALGGALLAAGYWVWLRQLVRRLFTPERHSPPGLRWVSFGRVFLGGVLIFFAVKYAIGLGIGMLAGFTAMQWVLAVLAKRQITPWTAPHERDS